MIYTSTSHIHHSFYIYIDIMLNVCCIRLTVQQAASLQLQDIEDTSNDSTFMDDVTSYSYNLNFVHPRANKKCRGQIYGESCKCTPRQRVHLPEAKQESNLLRKLGRSGRWERLFR